MTTNRISRCALTASLVVLILSHAPLSGGDFTRRCYAMILAGRIDACYQPDHHPVQFEAVREAFASRIKILYLPDPAIGLYSVFSKASAPVYVKPYAAALAAVMRGQSYGAVFERFIGHYVEKETTGNDPQ